MKLNTQIYINGNIIAFSDIHGDIHSLIIILRDCAKVIKKKDEYHFNQLEIDHDLEKLLNMDINDCTDDLNYEWIGQDTYVVICGDIIDPYRDGYGCKKNQDSFCHYYIQIELKILKFINAINRLAMKNGGRIIKLLGNHEWENIKGTFESYIFPADRDMNNYYIDENNNKFDRLTIFNYNKYGYKLLFEDWCGILIIINNIIFVHGGLEHDSNYNEIHQINNEMNSGEIWTSEKIRNWEKKMKKLLWNREFGLSDIPTDCKILQTRLGEFNPNINNPILVIGHCIQVNVKYPTNTLSKFVSNDDASITFTINNNNNNNNNDNDIGNIYGITSDCLNDNNTFSIYRTDVAVSRGFDRGILGVPEKDIINRTPQCLKFSNTSVEIIKSRVENTKIHLVREYTKNNYDYEYKYLKYKYKYLLLSNN
jgi:hypothetical protein